ncbi:unnamed protein product [Rotaria sp. Silwood1]|nr:unnamed protein product [Rotaria sp. Silwood1]CAF1569684.1 unnamed protein product [Rotaria sp. Silwood1]
MPNSPQFSQPNGNIQDHYYYQAIRVTVATSGNYSFESISHITTMGYLYDTSFDPSNPLANIIVSSDNDGAQVFHISSLLSSARTYILVVTTSQASVMGDFWILVHGPALVGLASISPSVGQRPWSEWKRTDTSCIQHTGHDVEQCVYPAFVSLPADLANRRTPHGPQQDHKLIVDSTFIAIHEPHDSEQRKEYYHAKSPTNYAIKVKVAGDFRHRIVHVSECYHGSIHDITVLRESGLLEHVEESVQIIGDKAYIGEEYVVTLRKKLRGRELTQEDKDFNRDINSARAAIENINQRLKAYAILGSVYRGRLDDFHKVTKIIQVVAAL